MRDYGTIDSGVWKHPDFKALSGDAKLLFCYLRSCDHGNILGCFHLPMLYIGADLGWGSKRVISTFKELLPNRFAVYCEATEFVLLPKHITKLPFQNQNQAKGALKIFSDIPGRFCALCDIAIILWNSWNWNNDITDEKQDWKPFIDRLDAVRKQSTIQLPTPEQEQELQQEQENKHSVPQAGLGGNGHDHDDEIKRIFAVWQAMCDHPKAILDDKRRKLILRWLKSGYTEQQLADAIRGCSVTPHNMGVNDRGERYDDLGLILRDGDHIDRFCRNWERPPTPPAVVSGGKGKLARALAAIRRHEAMRPQ